MIWRFVFHRKCSRSEYQLQQLGEEEKKMIRTQLSTCQKKEGVSEAEMNEFFTGKNLQSDKAKCLTACALEQFTIVCIKRRNPENYSVRV